MKMNGNSSRKTSLSSENDGNDIQVYVFDRRKGDKPEEKIQIGGLANFTSFQNRLREVGK